MEEIECMLKSASSMLEKQNFREAIEICTSIIEQNPNDYRGFNKRSKVYARMQNWESAISDITEAIYFN